MADCFSALLLDLYFEATESGTGMREAEAQPTNFSPLSIKKSTPRCGSRHPADAKAGASVVAESRWHLGTKLAIEKEIDLLRLEIEPQSR